MKKIIIVTTMATALAGSWVWAQGTAPRVVPKGNEERGKRFEFEERIGRGREWAPGQQRREFKPEEMRERMRQFMGARVKERLRASDDEWAVIEPLLDRVHKLRRQIRAGNWMIGRELRHAEEGVEPSAVQKAADALRQSVGDEAAAIETVKARLDELRAARAAAEADLKKALEELRAVLTVRQEAELVLMGVLD